MKHEKYWKLLEKIAIASEPVARSCTPSKLQGESELLAVGYNKNKTHPIAKRFQKTEGAEFLHAEVDCIKNALRLYDPEILTKATLYVLRVKRPDDDHRAFVRAMAKPCCGCTHAIDQFGIKKVYFTTDEGYSTL